MKEFQKVSALLMGFSGVIAGIFPEFVPTEKAIYVMTLSIFLLTYQNTN